MNWVDNLQNILVAEAAAYFEYAKIEKSEFQKYVESLTTVNDWDDDFIEIAFSLYLEKVNMAGTKLSDKMAR